MHTLPVAGAQPGIVCQVCQGLHTGLNNRPHYGFPYVGRLVKE